MKNRLVAFLCLLVLSCTRIETGDTLSPDELAFIQGVGLLDQGETVYQFYSNLTLRKAGSFFTDKRMAHYWLNGDDTLQHQREYAFYPDITAVKPVYQVPDFDCPYLQVRKKDQTTFRVYMEGSQEEMHQFYQQAVDTWALHRQKSR